MELCSFSEHPSSLRPKFLVDAGTPLIQQTLLPRGLFKSPFGTFSYSDLNAYIRPVIHKLNSVSMSVSATNHLLVVCDGARSFDVYSIPKGSHRQCLNQSLPTSDGPVIFCHDGYMIMGGQGDGAIYLWDAITGERLHALKSQSQSVRFLSYLHLTCLYSALSMTLGISVS